MRLLRRALLCLVILVAATEARAVTRTVCPGGTCDFTTVAAAVAASGANDVVLVSTGTYAGTITTPAVANVSIQADAGAVVTLSPTGAGTPDGYIIRYLTGTGLSVSGMRFVGDGASDQSGIYIDAASSLTLTDCTFSGLRECVRDGTGAGVATGFTATRVTFSSPQSGVSVNSRFSWAAGLDCTGPIAFTDCLFDFSAAADAPSWGSTITLGASTNNVSLGATFTRCAFVGKATTAKQTIRTSQAVTGLAFYDCSFSGTNHGTGGYIDLNITGAVDETVSDAIFYNCSFGPGPAIGVVARQNAAQSSDTAHKRFLFRKCRFTGGSAVTESGISLNGVTVSTLIVDCTFNSYSAANEGAIFMTSCRNPTVASCEFYNCDNSLGLTMSGVAESAFKNFNVRWLDNYCRGDGGDGAVIVHEFTNPTTSIQDSLFTLEGNVYESVSIVGRYVTAGGTQTSLTIGDWQTYLAGRAVTRGGDFGSVDGASAVGIGTKQLIIGGGAAGLGASEGYGN